MVSRFNFRVWDKENEKMVYPDGNGYFQLEYDTVIDGNGKLFNLVNQETVDTCILMQTTGLVDKNGKEVFEEDIIKFDGKYTKAKRLIRYSKEEGRLVACHTDFVYDYCDFNKDWISQWEVIGNIYENPELLIK